MIYRRILNECREVGKQLAKRHVANTNKAWSQVFLTSNALSYPLHHVDGGFGGVGEGFPPAGAVTGERRGGVPLSPVESFPWERLFAQMLHYFSHPLLMPFAM